MELNLTMIGNDNVSLRPLYKQDAHVIASLADNPRVAANLRDVFPSPYRFEDAVQFIELVQRGTFGFCRAILYRDQFAGVISITPQSDVYRHSAEIGYWLGEPFWNLGIMTAAIELTCAHAFNQLGITRIFAGVFGGNEASKAVLMKNGFKLEGVKTKGVLKNNRLLDEYFLALVKP